jgi:acetyl esterase
MKPTTQPTASAHGAEAQLDGTRLAVAGESVGGNMAAAVTLLAKQRGGPRMAGQVLFYPVTDANFDTGSYQQSAEGWFLTREAMKWFWDHYAPDVTVRAQSTVSPLRAFLAKETAGVAQVTANLKVKSPQ